MVLITVTPGFLFWYGLGFTVLGMLIPIAVWLKFRKKKK